MFAPKVAKPSTKTIASSTNSLTRQHSAFLPHRPSHGVLEQAHMLQRSIGNQATLRLLAQRTSSLTGEQPGGDHEQEAGRDRAAAHETTQSVKWSFSKIPIFPPDRPIGSQFPSPLSATPIPSIIQPKLVVGEVNDPLEHEADLVADRVMRMPDPDLSITSSPPQISRKCTTCEEAEAQALQTNPAGAPISAGLEAPGVVHEVIRSPAEPLDAKSRAYFEPRFGHNFSAVRIHTGAKAAESTIASGALAYAVGEHIVFGADQYAPHTEAGRRLLAHELAHVIQQRPGMLARQAPPSPGPSSPQAAINDADTRRIGTLLYVISNLENVISAVQAGLDPNPYDFTVPAIQNWLHVSPGDTAFLTTVQAAHSLFLSNLALTPTLIYQSNSVQVDPAGNACPPNFAYSRGGVGPIYFCDNFIAKGPNCQRDVMIHEHFHLLGLAIPPQPENYGAATTALALSSPDSLSQLAAEIASGPHSPSCLGSD
jgi:hypothetical protein